MEKSIVSVKNLSHRYSVQWAVKDVSFEINEKGVTGLLGSNGAGKSTTMNIICGVLNQTQGDVFINGVNLRENPVEAKKKHRLSASATASLYRPDSRRIPQACGFPQTGRA